ncbi:MAG: hypothetical protein N4A44_00590 [Alphaproteobacteria bacterium]|jgi:hypothetical protein|nr:hypothetical protein [Alphaproteobacteria bacterium]
MTNNEIKKEVKEETKKVEEVTISKKPDFLPKKFWDEEQGTTRLEEMSKSYKELEKKLSQLSQEVNSLKEEKIAAEDKNLLKGESLPSSPKQYLDEIDFDIINASEEINQVLFDAKYSVEQVRTFYDVLVKFIMPEILELYHDVKAYNDLEKLKDYFGGEEKFASISRQINSWAIKNLESRVYKSLSKDSKGVIAMYKMMQEEKNNNSSSINSLQDGHKKTREEEEKHLKDMMKNPSYWRDKDPEYRNKVEEGFKNLYT